MRTHKKTWLACLLAVAMLLSLVPMTALATGDAVTDEAGLRAAIAEGGEITIGADLIITDAITIDKDVVINLNGYSVSLPAGMGFSAEAAFIVNGADVAVNDGRLGYAGSGSLFKLVAVADATTSLTVNGVSCTAHDNWNEGVQVYPTSLFAVSAPAGTVKPTISLFGGAFTSAILDPEQGWGVPTGPLVSGDAADLKIYGGSFSIDPQEYIVDGAVSFEQLWGGEWQVLSEDAQMSEEFRSILNDEGKFVVNRYEPTGEEDLFYLYDALMMHFWDEDEGQSFTVYDATYDMEQKTMYFSMLDPDTGAILETHNVPLTFVYDPALKAEVDKLIDDLPDKVETPDGVEMHYFAVNDLELVNYWLTCSQEVDNINLLINYSDEFKKFIGYKNFRLDARLGDGDFFYTATAGIAEFAYNGTVYGIKEFGARAEHILYVAEDATDAVAAAQKRLDAYLGEGKVTLENCGTVLNMLEHLCYEYDWEWHEQNPNGTFEDYKASGCCPQINDVAAETGIESLLADDICVKTEINGVTYYMVIKKGSDKIVTPTYQNVDVNTDIAVKSEDTSIPLDTMLEVEQLTDGEEYDKIIAALNVGESVTFDIKLHSGSLDKYVTKLENGQFEVKIPVPENLKGKTLTVYYVDAQGKVTPHTVTPDGDYATFLTDHFSVYTLAAPAAATGGHGHAYPDKWESDKDNHWHACACGEKADVAAHTFKNGKCSVCGAVADDAGESPLTGDAGVPVTVVALALVGIVSIALTANGKKEKAEK